MSTSRDYLVRSIPKTNTANGFTLCSFTQQEIKFAVGTFRDSRMNYCSFIVVLRFLQVHFNLVLIMKFMLGNK